MDLEPFLLLAGVVVLCLLALVPVFLIIVWVRLRELQRRVESLEGRGVAAAPVVHVAPVVPVAPVAPIAPPPIPQYQAPKPIAPRPAPLAPVTPPIPEEKWVAPVAPGPQPRVEWERWLGVRGAAVLGGIFLAIAGVLFFQYSVQRNWITVERRVLIGILAGVAAMVGGQIARKRDYEFVGNAITGAGAVILYAAFWGASQFGVLPPLLCFAAMALVTAASCWLSYRTGSQLIAWLGLTGGFATPLLVSTGADRPIGLFGYILVLDLGFLFVAGRKRWPMLGLWGLAGTLLMQALWIVNRMDADELPIALFFLALFAGLFVVASALVSKNERGRWLVSQIGAVLVPFLFAFYFAGQDEIGYHLWPLALLAALLSGASVWLSRVQGAALVPVGAAAGSSAIALVWILNRPLDAERVLELAVCGLVLLLLFGFGREFRRPRLEEGAARGLEDAWLVAVGGLALDAFIACGRSSGVGPWAFVALFAGLAFALARVSASARLWWSSFGAGPLAVAGLLAWLWTHEGLFDTLEPRALEALAAVLLAAVFAALAWFGREGARAGFLGLALGAWFAALLSLTLTSMAEAPDPLGARLSLLFFAALACFGASAAGVWVVVPLSALICALSQGTIVQWNSALRGTWNDELTAALVSLAVLGAWLPVLKARIAAEPLAWIAAALVPLFWVPQVGDAISNLQGASGNLWIPVPFALAELAIAAWLLRGAERGSALARGGNWPLLVAIVCASAVLPLWVDRNVTVVWCALASVGAAWLGRRREFAPAYVAAAAAAVVCALGALGVCSGSFERLERAVLNARAFDFLLPALALLAAGTLAQRVTRVVSVVAGLLVALLWLTVEVHQAYAVSLRFELFWPRDEAREVAVSVAWAVYALVLLALGMRRKQSGLRWASLVLLMIVIGKLFLFDLSELQGLYRVASLLGLAVSLLLVSFGYQRFVFRKPAAGTTE